MTLTAKILGFSLLVSSSVVCSTDVATTGEKPAAIPAASAPKLAKQAIEIRKATYTLINVSFKPLGDVLKGTAEYNQTDVEKRAKRIVMLSEFLDNAFPDISNLGEPDTKAKAEVWTQRADFDKRLKEFQEHAAVLLQVAAKEKTASDAFKEAAGAVAKDCKGCHDNFKSK